MTIIFGVWMFHITNYFLFQLNIYKYLKTKENLYCKVTISVKETCLRLPHNKSLCPVC